MGKAGFDFEAIVTHASDHSLRHNYRYLLPMDKAAFDCAATEGFANYHSMQQ
jgi:hypothetical protein